MKAGKDIFLEIDRHLQQDRAPSEFLKALLEEGALDAPPLNRLSELRGTKQSPQHHPEGDVWNHTMLVVDEAAQVRERSSDVRAFMWAALLHDIGKPATTRFQKGKITSYDHDKVGEGLALTFLQEFGEPDLAAKVAALVRWHMQILFVVKDMPFADIPAMMDQVTLEDVALLGQCDRLGRLRPDREKELQTIRQFRSKVQAHGKKRSSQ